MSSDQNEFWGDEAEWNGDASPKPSVPSGPPARDVIRGWWSSLLGAGTTANRHHGTPSRPAPDPTPADVTSEIPVTVAAAARPAEFAGDADWDADWSDDADRPAGAVDPLLARMGAMAIIVTLLIPILFSLRSGGGDDAIESGLEAAAAAALAPPDPPPSAPGSSAASTEQSAESEQPADPAPAATPAAEAAAGADTAEQEAPAADTAPAARSVEQATGSTNSSESAESSEPTATAPIDDAADSESGADRVERVCAIEYDVVAGDFWIRLADAAGVPLAELLEANGATTRTPLYPGTTICLPAGSTIPETPATTTPPTTTPPTTTPPTTTPPTTTPPTTTPPTTTPPTTAPPTTAPPATAPPSGPEAIKQIIRDIWPDELEDKALDIAYRESRYDPLADNHFCCYGVFQIYWEVHRGWLEEVGIYSIQDLFNAELNTRAAYALYQRAGGWGPWGG